MSDDLSLSNARQRGQNLNQYPGGGNMDHAEEAFGELVVSTVCDGAVAIF
jgi:hypothetical protein